MARYSWMVTALVTASCLALVQAGGTGDGTPGAKVIGLYTFVGERLTADAMDELPDGLPAFARFCGYNTLEFCDWSFEYPTGQLPEYFRKIRKAVSQAHGEGLQVYMILLTNMSRERAVANIREPDPGKKGSLLFDPISEPRQYRTRMADIRTAIQEAYREVDGFEVFAGDWGGCLGKGCDYSQYLRFGRDYAAILRELGIQAELVLNTWAVANWGVSFDPAQVSFWDAEIALSKQILGSDLSFAGAINLPGHHLYRYLTRQIYVQAGRTVPQWPDRQAIEAIQRKGKRAYLWPHFLVDDDRGRAATWRKIHFEVRYLKDLAMKIHELNANGAFVNTYAPDYQMGNIYAFGRLMGAPSASPRSILKDFARLLVEEESVPALTEIFSFMENHSWWHSQTPEPYRLEPLPCAIATFDEALRLINEVRPLRHAAAPLLIPPIDYLSRLRETLDFMKR